MNHDPSAHLSSGCFALLADAQLPKLEQTVATAFRTVDAEPHVFSCGVYVSEDGTQIVLWSEVAVKRNQS